MYACCQPSYVGRTHLHPNQISIAGIIRKSNTYTAKKLRDTQVQFGKKLIKVLLAISPRLQDHNTFKSDDCIDITAWHMAYKEYHSFCIYFKTGLRKELRKTAVKTCVIMGFFKETKQRNLHVSAGFYHGQTTKQLREFL